MNNIMNGTGLAQIKAREGEGDLAMLENINWDSYPDFTTFCDLEGNLEDCDLEGYANAHCDWMAENFE